jgi:hypothetical protein
MKDGEHLTDFMMCFGASDFGRQADLRMSC